MGFTDLFAPQTRDVSTAGMACTINIDGYATFPVTGFTQDEPYTFDAPDQTERQFGNNGAMAVGLALGPQGVTLNLLAGGDDVEFLLAAREAQKNLQRTLRVAIELTNPAAKESYTMTGGAIGTFPPGANAKKGSLQPLAFNFIFPAQGIKRIPLGA